MTRARAPVGRMPPGALLPVALLPVALLRVALLPVALLMVAVLAAGCGGSVADADRPSASRTTRAPPSPFCAAVQANSDALDPVTSLPAQGSIAPAELSDTVLAAQRTGDALLAASPDDIRPDVERYVRAVGLQLDVLVAAGGDASALTRDTDLAAELTSPEAAASGRRLQDYVQRTCDGTASG